MARFYFQVHDGRELRDADGTELESLQAARRYAVKYAGELLNHTDENFWDGTDWRMEVQDEAGLCLFTLHFVAIDAPAAGLR